MRVLFFICLITVGCSGGVVKKNPTTGNSGPGLDGTKLGDTAGMDNENGNDNENGDDKAGSGNLNSDTPSDDAVAQLLQKPVIEYEVGRQLEDGAYGWIKIEPKASSKPGYFALEIPFKALRTITSAKYRVPPSTGSKGGGSWAYRRPELIVSFPPASAVADEHQENGHIRAKDDQLSASGLYEVTLLNGNKDETKMVKNNSFRLKFSVLKSALENGTLGVAFNVQFNHAHLAELQQFTTTDGRKPTASISP